MSKGLFIMGFKPSYPKLAIDFITKFTSSDQFDRVFKEGMGLVEETANYLDGPGRVDSRQLDRVGSIAYATESMRLTTRLMQLASWLLLQRAIVSGELSADDAHKEKNRISLLEIGAGNRLEGGEQLPQGLLDLVERSLRLLERIRAIDGMLNRDFSAEDQSATRSPVSDQMDRLQRAFGSN